MTPARIHDARLCELGEGLLWHPLRGQLFWFDILAGRMLSRAGDTQLDWSFGEYASAAGWIDAGTLMIATETGLRRFDIASGAHEPLVALEADRPDTRSNDGRADPQGGFWIGTMGKRAETGAGAIYRYYRGNVERLFPGISIPNAICFAADGRTAYFTDSKAPKILSQPLDAEGWPEGAPDVLVDFTGTPYKADGAVVDAEGYIWTAQWGAGRVARYAPDGRFDRAIAVGGVHSSCPAFGGADLTTLYCTTAREGLDHPTAADGALYVAEPGIAGRPEPRVIV